jgi:hypothetical protein
MSELFRLWEAMWQNTYMPIERQEVRSHGEKSAYRYGNAVE